MAFRLGAEYARGLRTSIRNNAGPYGYSVMITVSVASLDTLAGPITLRRLVLVVVGASAAFTGLEAAVSNLFRERVRGEPSEVVMLGSALEVASIGAGLAVTAGIGSMARSWVAWLLGPFAATVAYLLVVGIELVLARRAEHQPDPEAEEEPAPDTG